MKNNALNLFGINIFAVVLAVAGFIAPADAANVVQRGRVSASTTSAPGSRASTARAPIINETITPEPEPEPEPEPVIADVSSTFTVGTSASDSNDDTLANAIARQRAALDAQSAIDTVSANTAKADSKNKCDTGLRKCMTEKCGSDFKDCVADNNTIWGSKLDSCRTKLECTNVEFNTFAAEIKADRDILSSLATYNKVLSCGNEYNTCITNQCGKTYSKCLGKTAIDAAIAECKSIANNCREYDSGLAARTGEFITVLRESAEIQIATDEKRLYDLREQMRKQCEMLHATLDERTMSCVYSVGFYADKDKELTLFSSKKAYAGATFDCTPNWFGIDITTFKENAYRLTRGQTAASSAMLGAGVGTAAGLITSGALDRAIETQKAEKEVTKAQKEHATEYGSDDLDLSKKEQRQIDRELKKEERQENRAERKEERQENRAERKEERQENRAERKEEKQKQQNIKKAEKEDNKAVKNTLKQQTYEKGTFGGAMTKEEKYQDASLKYHASQMDAEKENILSSMSMTGVGLMPRSNSANTESK